MLQLPTDQEKGLKQWLIIQGVHDQVVAQKDELSLGPKSKVDLDHLMLIVADRANMGKEREAYFLEKAALKEQIRSYLHLRLLTLSAN